MYLKTQTKFSPLRISESLTLRDQMFKYKTMIDELTDLQYDAIINEYHI